ncbi:MAG: hypothetical protein K0Q46_5549 [Rhodococcus erythropolis]|jgi:hypothetical protein|nr:hypothetical protein [Rhodococcus erythropolis]
MGFPRRTPYVVRSRRLMFLDFPVYLVAMMGFLNVNLRQMLNLDGPALVGPGERPLARYTPMRGKQSGAKHLQRVAFGDSRLQS